MALLQDLIRDAASDAVSTPSLLRQARIVATRLKISEAEKWIESELFGYSHSDEVPPYRGPLDVRTLGNFVGPFGSSVSHALIPLSVLPERFHPERLSTTRIRQSIPEIEDLLKAERENGLGAPWTADMVAQFNFHHSRGDFTVYEGMGALAIWSSLSPSQLHGVLDAVRTRVLDFALLLEAEHPQAGERAGESLVTPEKGNDIFNTTINGTGANVALGSTSFTQNSYTGRPQSEDALIGQLREAGVSDQLLTELTSALAEDRDESGGTLEEPGPRVQGWLGRVVALGSRSSEAIGTGVTSAVATQLVLGYFGLGG
jgi:hypothetical protein